MITRSDLRRRLGTRPPPGRRGARSSGRRPRSTQGQPCWFSTIAAAPRILSTGSANGNDQEGYRRHDERL